MKLLTVAAGTLLLAAAFATPGQAAPTAPATAVLTGAASEQITDVRWHGRPMMRSHRMMRNHRMMRRHGWSRGRHMGWRHHRRWR